MNVFRSKTTTPLSTNSPSRSPVRHDFILIAFACAVFALAPIAMAVDPPPDGGYPGNNTAEGEDALFSLNVAGQDNTAIGFRALYSLQGKDENTAVGSQALFLNVSGEWNTAVGFQALYHSTGIQNTAVGHLSLFRTTTGTSNTAIGTDSLFFNSTGNYNTATGWRALYNNTTGSYNTATGMEALGFNHSGDNNTATGHLTLYFNTNGNSNSAHGEQALYSNSTGAYNTALGSGALYGNSTGSNNIGVGSSAGTNLTTGSNNIDIGSPGVVGESTTIRVGTVGTHANTYIAGISGVTVAGGIGVIVDSNGHLGTSTSSARYKENIQPMDKASEALLALKPVTFRYKKDLDPNGIPQFGLLAEQVDKIDPDLVARDGGGKPYTVRYDAVNAMLLNELLKEHRKVEQLEKQVEVLTAGLQKVSAQLELSHSAPQTVVNDQ